jgi:hypothetical protein
MSQENVAQPRAGFEMWGAVLNEPDEAIRRSVTAGLSSAYHPEARIDFSRTISDSRPPAQPRR